MLEKKWCCYRAYLPSSSSSQSATLITRAAIFTVTLKRPAYMGGVRPSAGTRRQWKRWVCLYVSNLTIANLHPVETPSPLYLRGGVCVCVPSTVTSSVPIIQVYCTSAHNWFHLWWTAMNTSYVCLFHDALERHLTYFRYFLKTVPCVFFVVVAGLHRKVILVLHL